MKICDVCGIPSDASFFDESSIKDAPIPGEEAILARYLLHRNYCGVLMNFAQFTDPSHVDTPGFRWQIRCDGQPRDPYLGFEHIVNPWGQPGGPVHLRLEEGCLLELVVRNVGAPGQPTLIKVGGRMLGRYWYNTAYGGVPDGL
jgi:hypothetical protein